MTMKNDIAYTVPSLISDWLSQSDTVQRRRSKPSVSQQLGAWYDANQPHDDQGDRPFGIIVQDDSLIAKIMQITNNRRAKRYRQFLRIQPVPSVVPHIRTDMRMTKIGGRPATAYGSMLGTFMVTIPGTAPLFVISYMISRQIVTYLIGCPAAIDALNRILSCLNRRLITKLPTSGIHTAETLIRYGEQIIHYRRETIDLENTARFRIHPMFQQVNREVTDFFEKIDWWTRHHQPGIRKILLAGPPGTGKTSIIAAIAAEFARSHVIVHTQDTNQMVSTCEAAARAARPAIVVCEELDLLKKPSGSGLLWLDCTTCTRNPAGTFVITTTNYPSQIDPRVRKRPGRLDAVLTVADLRPSEASRIAASYLMTPLDAPALTELGRSLDRTTPAEIREIINIAYRRLSPGDPLDVEAIKAARIVLARSYERADEATYETEAERSANFERFGPRFDPADIEVKPVASDADEIPF
jgi:hypothetical protein